MVYEIKPFGRGERIIYFLYSIKYNTFAALNYT